MQHSSKPVSSNQQGMHPRLPEVVRRHLQHPGRKPTAAHDALAFSELQQQRAGRPLVFDSFCGTGHSTAALAERHPDHLVVGIDKSAARLARHPAAGRDRYLLLQADCEGIWQLAAAAGWRLDYHYLLYPNPWPKAAQLQRRVYGSAALPYLLQLGGLVELRSNWQLYVEEFGLALQLAGWPGAVARWQPQRGLTLFEEKYRQSGHDLWRYRGRVQPAS